MKLLNKLLYNFLILSLCIILFGFNKVSANPKYASLVIDADTGVILHQSNASKKRYPASLTKLMTLYLTFDAIEKGKLSLNDKLIVSKRAQRQPRSRLGLKKGERIKVKDAILAVIVKSANDASVVLAEALSGSEWKFAQEMTQMAKKLGMKNTIFKNASGLYNKRQETTAYDMARLAVSLQRDFRKYYPLFKKTKFYYKGRRYNSHNLVTKKYYGAEGLKTGYIRASGYNLVTSVKRSDNRVVAVVLGGKTSRSRDKHMMKLLDRAFSKIVAGHRYKNKIYISNMLRPEPKLKPTNSRLFSNILPIPVKKPIDDYYDTASLLTSRFTNSKRVFVPSPIKKNDLDDDILSTIFPLPKLKPLY